MTGQFASTPNSFWLKNHKWNTPALFFKERPLVCSFLLRSLPYLLINLQEAVYTMLTQLHSLGKKPKICLWNTFLYAHQENTLRYHYEYQSVTYNCKLRELWWWLSDKRTLTHTHCPCLIISWRILLAAVWQSRNSSYPDAQLTRCGTTAWQLGLAWLLLKSKIRTSWVLEVKLPCCYWM